MFEFLAFISNKKYWKLHSNIVKIILSFFYKIKVGNNFYIEGVPHLKIKGKAENIIIGDNVSILGNIDLRNRENGKIHFMNKVTIEKDCRFVAAREGTIKIGEGSVVTAFAIMNAGSNITIKENCIIGPRASINSSEHEFIKTKPIREQGFVHSAIIIEEDCWLATNVLINKGVCLAKGSIVASNTVVTKNTEPYSINAGVPSKKISDRK